MSSTNDATDVLRNAGDEEAVTTVLSDLFESLESADDIPTWDDGPDASAFIAKPDQELDDLMPEGPFTIRLMGTVYDEVYEDLMLQLLRRGLLAGAEVWNAPHWIPFSEHPDFGGIQAQMAAEVERLVARNQPPRELTPQPHWRTPQNVRSSEEVTRPSVRLSDIEGMEFESEGLDEETGGGLAHRSESLDETRKTAEFDSEPFRRFADEMDAQRVNTGAQTIDPARPPARPADSEAHSAQRTWDEVPDTEVSESLTPGEPQDEEVEIAASSRGDLRIRQHSPLEGSHTPRTTFPVEAGRSEKRPATGHPPGAAIVNRPDRKGRAAERMQQPTRKKQPTAALPRANSNDRADSAESRTVGSNSKPKPKSRIPTWLVYMAVVAIVVSIVALAVVAVQFWTAYADASPTPGPSPSETAIRTANAQLHGSLPAAFSDARDIAAVANSLSTESAHERVWILSSLHASKPTAESAVAAATASLDAGDVEQAKGLAAEAIILGAELSVVRPIFARALEKTPTLQRNRKLEWTSIERLAGDSNRLVARVDGSDWIVVPATKTEPDAHRAMLAYGRLCEAVQCGFDVPKTEMIEISRSALTGAEQPEETLDSSSLHWVEDEERDVVDAAAFRLPDNFEPFPIDDEPRWRGWLGVDELRPDEHAELMSRSRGIAPVELVRQLSNLMTIDYLTNNWSRIPDADLATTVLVNGELTTIWHGAAFATRSSRRVEDRFRWVERFDRRLVAQLRIITPDMLDHHLFVDGDPISDARRDEFWSQREELLEAVEDAEKGHGDAIWL